MSYIKVWLHFVWSTKDRKPFLTDDIRQKVFQHIRENAREKGIFIDFINGYVEHVHCLISLGSDQTIEKIMQLIKGESSFWINKNRLCKEKFAWQDDYFVVSVSENVVDNVREYIKNQEAHHKEKSFDEEFETFLKRAGFQRFQDWSAGFIFNWDFWIKVLIEFGFNWIAVCFSWLGKHQLPSALADGKRITKHRL
jgi:putative transposase